MDKGQIIFRLINTEYYEEMLNCVPHREFYDLSIVYYELEQDTKIATLMSHQVVDKLNLSEQELYELAMANTKELCPPSVKRMSEALKESGEEIEDELSEKEDIYIITNEYNQFGAVSILYEDTLDKVAQIVGTDLYLLPSSQHEFLAITVNEQLPLDELQKLVCYVNMTEVEPEERLSNQVYHYDMITKEITLATHGQYVFQDSVKDKWLDKLDEIASPDGDMQMGMQMI